MGDNMNRDNLFDDDDDYGGGGEGLFGAWPDADWRDFNYRQRQTGGTTHEPEQYHSSYTHPSQTDPGFTFDFALPSADTYRRSRLFPPTSINNPIVLDDDDDNANMSSSSSIAIAGPSSSSSDTGQVTATLVCARCSDLLLINAALHPSENDRRVWGLRCGHIIDEKCLNQLGQPPPRQVLDDDNSTETYGGRGEGKAKATTTGPTPSYGDTIVAENQTVLEAIQENSIRSRLRSRPGVSTTTPPSDRQPPLKRRRVSNKKKRIVEAVFQWKCPVDNCGRVHVSIKVDGVWGPEKERESVVGGHKSIMGGQLEARGAIPIFA
jgi:hypothetical protein